MHERMQRPELSVYVAGKVNGAELAIGGLMKTIRDAGHRIKWDWRTIQAYKPYLDHPDHNQPIAEDMRTAIAGADRFVLLDDPELLGAHIELGMFLATHFSLKECAYIMPGDNFRQSIFYTLPQVEVVETVDMFKNIVKSEKF